MEKVAPMSGEQTTVPETDHAVNPEQVTAAFESGFNDDEQDSPQATATPPAPEPEPQSTSPSTAPAPAPAPEYVQVTRADWDRINASAAKVDEIAATLGKMPDQIYGTMGRTLERRLAELQQATPQGAAVEISEEDFADLKAEYPELADATRKALNKTLSKIKGTGADAKAIEARTGEARQAITAEVTDVTLDAIVKGDWQAEVKTERFDGWLKGQTPEVQGLASSPKLRDAARMLRLYKEHVDAPAPAPTPAPAPAAPAQPSMRSRQMAAAVAPRGDVSATSTSKGKSPFEQGFEDDD